MSDLNLTTESSQQDSPNTHGSGGNHAWWGVVLCLLAIAGLGYYAYSSQVELGRRVAAAQQRTTDLTEQLRALKKANASVSSGLEQAVDRLGATTKELASTREATDSLRRAQTKTAKDARANAEAVASARQEAAGQVADVNGRVTSVSNDVKSVAANLAAARQDVENNRRQISASEALIAKNGVALADLRQQNERDIIPFDIRKNSSPETWTVAGIRIELKKTDVKKSEYNVVLHVDDRLLARKNLTANEPVPLIVGPNHQRYEVVVNSVEHDRIRGYVSVPKGVAAETASPLASRQVS
jgi:hypothetical protein